MSAYFNLILTFPTYLNLKSINRVARFSFNSSRKLSTDTEDLTKGSDLPKLHDLILLSQLEFYRFIICIKVRIWIKTPNLNKIYSNRPGNCDKIWKQNKNWWVFKILKNLWKSRFFFKFRENEVGRKSLWSLL